MTVQSRPKPRMGIFDRPYWEWAGKGELRLQKCGGCGHVRYPPGPICPRCLSDECDWAALSGKGKVVAWTVFHRQYFPEFPVPFTVVSVEADEGPLLIGQLRNAEDVQVGPSLPVRALFEDVQSGDGGWRICQWEPDLPTTMQSARAAQSGERP